eukprot:2968294-Pleurochrysis_carterae.AAC.2
MELTSLPPCVICFAAAPPQLRSPCGKKTTVLLSAITEPATVMSVGTLEYTICGWTWTSGGAGGGSRGGEKGPGDGGGRGSGQAGGCRGDGGCRGGKAGG